MKTERGLGQKEQKTALEGLGVFKVGKDYLSLKDEIADHYFRAWHPQGLCQSPLEAERRLGNYYEAGIFETSFIVAGPEKEKIYSLLLTVNLQADSILDLLEKIPSYRLFESVIPGSKGSLGFSICFSITAEERFCVKAKNGLNVSLSRLNLFGHETPSGYYKTAYSRLQGVGRTNPYRFYSKNVALPRTLGPTGMHEEAYGGVTFAIIKGSRPEDAAGGRSNTFILLPNDETQKEINSQILENRRRGFVPYEKIGPFILFTDTWPYLSLAR